MSYVFVCLQTYYHQRATGKNFPCSSLRVQTILYNGIFHQDYRMGWTARIMAYIRGLHAMGVPVPCLGRHDMNCWDSRNSLVYRIKVSPMVVALLIKIKIIQITYQNRVLHVTDIVFKGGSGSAAQNLLPLLLKSPSSPCMSVLQESPLFPVCSQLLSGVANS